jgi:hypothetical protein
VSILTSSDVLARWTDTSDPHHKQAQHKVGGVAETDCVSRTRDLGLRSGQGMQSTQVHPVQPCLSNFVSFLSLQFRLESKISETCINDLEIRAVRNPT